MLAIFPSCNKNIEGVFVGAVVPIGLYKPVLKRMVLTVAVSDKDPLKRGANFECRSLR